ncbi:hypothetical protein NDU88_006279, partial [Pleurodeles waltl]
HTGHPPMSCTATAHRAPSHVLHCHSTPGTLSCPALPQHTGHPPLSCTATAHRAPS